MEVLLLAWPLSDLAGSPSNVAVVLLIVVPAHTRVVPAHTRIVPLLVFLSLLFFSFYSPLFLLCPPLLCLIEIGDDAMCL